MITDALLNDYLQKTTLVPLQPVGLPMGNQGEKLANWQVHFNRLSDSEMYSEYKSVVSQLIHGEMDDRLRLSLMESVFNIASRMFVGLKQGYQNSTGFLNESQQQSLDIVLSAYYLGIMFYHSVWQRAASSPIIEQKKGLSALLKRPTDNASDSVIQACLYGMMSLLREALYEKYLGYRRDTQVLWQYLNACYRFMTANGWEQYKPKSASLYAGKHIPTLFQIYAQCLLAHVINPYACRRPDLMELHEKALFWIDGLVVSPEQAQRPFLFVNLLGNEPPQLHHAGMAFNPFAKDSECVFLSIEPLKQRLSQVIETGKTSQDINAKLAARHAQIVKNNVENIMQPPISYTPVQTTYQAVVGFNHIHYMLANRSSLNNLIQAHTLPERLRPRHQPQQQLNKSTTVKVVGTQGNHRHLAYHFSYPPFEAVSHSQGKRNTEYHLINHLQVQSLVALRHSEGSNKVWHIGRIEKIQQTPDLLTEPQPNAATGLPKPIDLTIEGWVTLFGSNVVPCGVRIQNFGTRPCHFMPALIIPKNTEFGHEQTSIMMARFGYNVGDKLIIRIEAKEVNISLTELLYMSDDIEEYAFVRLQ